MSASCYKDLRAHVGHKLECVTYGDEHNVAIECTDCNEVLLDFDNAATESYKITRKTANRTLNQDKTMTKGRARQGL